MDRRAVLELVEDAARLARAGEAREARAARADAPGRNGDGEGGRLGGDRLDVDAAALEPPAERGKILVLRMGELGVLLGDQVAGNAIGHGFLLRPV